MGGGGVYIGLKDAVFEASFPLRHAAELSSILDPSKPLLLLYTDGGPDHRLTYLSTQIALTCLFLKYGTIKLLEEPSRENNEYSKLGNARCWTYAGIHGQRE